MNRVVGTCGPRQRSDHTTSPVWAWTLSYAVRSPVADLHDLGRVELFVRIGTALELDELQLVGLVGELLAGIVERVVAPAREPLPGLDDLPHRRLQRTEVVGRERGGDVEVVVEAVGDRRADAQLGLGVQLLDGLREHVCRGVPDDAAAVLRVGGDGLDLHVDIGRPRQVAEPSLRRHGPRRSRPAHCSAGPPRARRRPRWCHPAPGLGRTRDRVRARTRGTSWTWAEPPMLEGDRHRVARSGVG